MQTNKIQIITINNYRYVGNLHNISQVDKSVELKNIVCFGTEDREPQGPDKQFVPKSAQIIDFQIFQGKQIKKLNVINKEEKPAASAGPGGARPTQAAEG